MAPLTDTNNNRFHRHSLGQLLGRSVELLRQECVSYLKLAAMLVVPLIVFNAIYFEHLHALLTKLVEQMAQDAQQQQNNNGYNGNTNNNGAAPSAEEQELIESFVHMMGKLFWLFLFLALLGTVVKAAMIRTTAQAFVPTSVTMMTNLRHGLNRLPTMMLWGLLYVVGLIVYSLVVGITMAILVVVASALFNADVGALFHALLSLGNLFLTYYITLVLVFCMPSIVVERISAWQSFFRAWDMAQGHRCMILCALLALGFGSLLTFALEYVIFHGLGWNVLAIINGITSLFWMPLGTILITLLYLNVRVDKEGLNAQVLTQELFQGDAALGIKTSTSTTAAGGRSSLEDSFSDDVENDKNEVV